MNVVALDLLPDGRTSIRPRDGKRRTPFLEAVRAAGGRHDRNLAVHVCERDQTPKLLAELDAREFRPSLSGALGQALSQHAKTARARRRAAGGLASAADRRVAGAGGTLYPFQRRGVAWLSQRERALLADQPGLGKTLQALMATPRGGSAVVVCPASVKGVWRSEAARWRPDLEVTVLKGRRSFRWPKPDELMVTNYEILPAPIHTPQGGLAVDPKLGNPPMGLALIADEAHALRVARTQRTRKFRALSRATLRAGGRVWLLTGTPMLAKPLELYNVLMAASLEGEAFGTWSNFCRLFHVSRGRWNELVFTDPHPDVPRLLSRVCLRRLRADVLPELPEKTEREIVVNNIDARTRSLCREAWDALQEAGVDLSQAASTVDLSNWGTVTKRIASARLALASAKIPALVEIAESYESAGEPLVVFSAQRAPIDVLAKREGWATITGDVAPGARTKIAAAFRDGEYRGLAVTIAAGGVGLTFSGGKAKAAHAVFNDLDYTPALNSQAADRLHRIGQTRGVLITRLVADHPLDAHVTRLLARKADLIERTVPTTVEGGIR